MTRSHAYKYLLLGAVIRSAPKFENGRRCFSYLLGSTVPVNAFYKKNPGNGLVVWTTNVQDGPWYECAAYDPIFIDEIEEFEWKVS